MDYPIPTPEEQHKGPDLRQQHYNGDAGRVLPRDGEPKKSSFVRWEDSITTTSRDQGKNNMTPEPCHEEKTMRKSGGESQVKKQAGFSNNVGSSAKAKTGVDNPTGNIDTSVWSKKDNINCVLVGVDINQYGMLSNDRKEDGKTVGVQSKNVADPLNRPHQLFQGENSTASPTIPSDDEKDEKGHENATFDINVDPQTTPSNAKEMKEHEDDGTKSHPDPSKTIANDSEAIKNVEPPYLPPQSEGGCSPCCPPCSYYNSRSADLQEATTLSRS